MRGVHDCGDDVIVMRRFVKQFLNLGFITHTHHYLQTEAQFMYKHLMEIMTGETYGDFPYSEISDAPASLHVLGMCLTSSYGRVSS